MYVLFLFFTLIFFFFSFIYKKTTNVATFLGGSDSTIPTLKPSKIFAGILLNRVHAVGKAMRRRMPVLPGSKQYVKSGLSMNLSSVVSVEAWSKSTQDLLHFSLSLSNPQARTPRHHRYPCQSITVLFLNHHSFFLCRSLYSLTNRITRSLSRFPFLDSWYAILAATFILILLYLMHIYLSFLTISAKTNSICIIFIPTNQSIHIFRSCEHGLIMGSTNSQLYLDKVSMACSHMPAAP